MNADPALDSAFGPGSDADPVDATETGGSGVFGHYRLDEEIGHGGMGVVYRAYDTRRHRIVAIKRMPRHLAMDEEFRTRFQRESALAAKLREPHVVPIHDYGEIDGQLYIDMRLVEGVDLGTVIRKAPLSLPRAVDVVSQIADALDAAHEDGLVHRDVKPSNVLLVGKPSQVADRGFAYLADFGIAANLGGSTLSRPGLALGTASYMAPERMVGEPWDHRVDVYSLACVLFEVVVGRRPYQAEDLLGMLHAHLNKPTPRPSEFVDGLPNGFDDVVARGMAKKSGDRFDSCGEFAAAARDLLEGWAPAPPSTTVPHTGAPKEAGKQQGAEQGAQQGPRKGAPKGPQAPAPAPAAAPRSSPAPPTPLRKVPRPAPSDPTSAAPPPSGVIVTPGSAAPGTGPAREAPARSEPEVLPAAASGPAAPTVSRPTPLVPGPPVPSGPPADPRTSGPTRRVAGPAPDPSTSVLPGRPLPGPVAGPTVVTNPRPAQRPYPAPAADGGLEPYPTDPDRPEPYPTDPARPEPRPRRRRRTSPVVTIIGAVLVALALAAGTLLVLTLIKVPEPPLISVDFYRTGAAPAEIALTPDGTRAYVTNLAADTVSVLDTATGQPVVPAIAVGDEPNSVRVAGNGKAYVSNQKSGTVSIIDTATNTVAPPVKVGVSVDGIAVSPDGRVLYAGIAETGTVVTVDTATRNVVGAPIKVGDKNYGMVLSADGTRLYVPNLGSDTVSVIDTATRKVVATVPVGDEPVGAVIGPDGRVYVANTKSGTLSIIDPVSNTVVENVAVGTDPVGLAVRADGSRVYVSSRKTDAVRVLTTADRAVSAPVAVGAGPVSIAVAPDGRVLVVGERANAVSVLRPGSS